MMSSFNDDNDNDDSNSVRFSIGIIGDIQYCDKDNGSDHSGKHIRRYRYHYHYHHTIIIIINIIIEIRWRS